MAQPWAKQFYSSDKWQRCRSAYIAQRIAVDGGMCEVCHEKPGYIVHHKTWLTEWNINDPYISLNFDNLRYECQDCHNAEENHNRQPAHDDAPLHASCNEDNIFFDENGDLYAAPDSDDAQPDAASSEHSQDAAQSEP